MLLASVALKAQNTFTGSWGHMSYYSNNEAEGSFNLTLKENNGMITGFHFAVSDGGRFIDDYGKDSINGTVENGIATVAIKSGRTAKITGVAEIKHISRDSVIFTLIKEPGGGEHLIPEKVILVKYDPGNSI